jgi:hypothetical protein
MDYKGQQLAERLIMAILTVSAAVALIMGWSLQSVTCTLCTFGAGTVLAMAVTVPDYPCVPKYTDCINFVAASAAAKCMNMACNVVFDMWLLSGDRRWHRRHPLKWQVPKPNETTTVTEPLLKDAGGRT